MKLGGLLSTILNEKGPQVWSVNGDAMVFDAIKFMSEKNVGALPVVEGTRLVGIVSERDYTRKIILKGRSSRQTPVREIMSREVVTAKPSDTAEECMRIMTEKHIRHLPVMDDGQMVGMISIGDLVNWVISAQNATIEQLEQYIGGGYSA
jgi:CBS domain-containing protein